MPKFKLSARSKAQLETCNSNLKLLFEVVLSLGVIDITIIEGRRSRELQQKYFKNHYSKVQWPNSKHNVLNPNELSMAVDVAPCINGKVSWEKEHCIFLAGLVMATAKMLGIVIRWGGNWDCDAEPITDQDFMDLLHYELTGEIEQWNC